MRIAEPPAGPILAIAAHPDDIESWCGGTLALAIEAGAEARLLLVTSGDKGSADPDADPGDVAAIREAEATEAGKRLGIVEVAFLRHRDGEVMASQALRGEIVRWIRRRQPKTLFTHDPEHPDPPYLFHPDHRAVGRAVLDAVYPLARDPLAFPEHRGEGLDPHRVENVWLFASAIADSFVDINGGFERKLAARLAHASQTPDPAALPGSWRERSALVGHPAGLPLAEAFTVLEIRSHRSRKGAPAWRQHPHIVHGPSGHILPCRTGENSWNLPRHRSPHNLTPEPAPTPSAAMTPRSMRPMTSHGGTSWR